MFDAEKIKNECVAWIRDFFEENGPDSCAVIGISGGKDSSVAAALCAEALGRHRVVGVMMPCGEQADIDCSIKLVEHLGIRSYTVNIGETMAAMKAALPKDLPITAQTETNLPSRVRLAALYAVSQSCNGRVVVTGNLSEDWVGYFTRYGIGAAGDLSLLSGLTVAEVKEVGYALGLPRELVDKVPIDGLCGKTDEDNLGFTYATLDRYIRTGECDDLETKALIDRKHAANLFKLRPIPGYKPGKGERE